AVPLIPGRERLALRALCVLTTKAGNFLQVVPARRITDYHCSPALPRFLGSALPDHRAVASIELGEVHLAVAHDGTHTTILNGGYVRSVRRYQNKLKAHRTAYLDRKKKGSQRRRRSIQEKQKRLKKVERQLRDALHKLTTKLVS